MRTKDHLNMPYMNLFYIFVSFLGIFFLIILVISPPYSGLNLPLRKPVTGLLFALICTLGALASLFPKKCSNITHYSNISAKTPQDPQGLSKGHHPACKQFSSHTIVLRGQVICAGCTGLFIGALISLVGASLYFFLGFGAFNAHFYIALGMLGLILGFVQLAFRGYARSLANVFFVMGALMILVGVDSLTQNFFIDLFVLVLILFWIITRIELSRWDHTQICLRCVSIKKECELVSKS